MSIKITTGIIVTFMAIFSSASILAQNTVSGKVSDISGKGISGASVTASGGRGALTNDEGNFSLSLPNGSATITASFVEYAALSKERIGNAHEPMRAFDTPANDKLTDAAGEKP